MSDAKLRRWTDSIPWRMLTATRNRLLHGYLGIDNDTLCSNVETDVPALLKSLRDLKTV